VFGDKAPTGNKSPSSLRDFELLGDMHLRQGKAREAIKTYQDALSLNMEPKQAAAIYRKIAQADLALEDDAGAKKALEMAQQFLKHQAQAAEGNAPKQQTGGSAPKPQAAPLVSKLIISAPKRLLDQVAAGKMAFHDFEKQVAAEYIGFSTLPPPKIGRWRGPSRRADLNGIGSDTSWDAVCVRRRTPCRHGC
jgi:tetratricopeptide (TPR) repeat protein